MADKAIEPERKVLKGIYQKQLGLRCLNLSVKTDDKKKRESRKGKQFVKNTDKAKKARKAVSMAEKRKMSN